MCTATGGAIRFSIRFGFRHRAGPVSDSNSGSDTDTDIDPRLPQYPGGTYRPETMDQRCRVMVRAGGRLIGW